MLLRFLLFALSLAAPPKLPTRTSYRNMFPSSELPATLNTSKTALYYIHYSSPPDIAKCGIEFVTYIPHQTYLVYTTAERLQCLDQHQVDGVEIMLIRDKLENSTFNELIHQNFTSEHVDRRSFVVYAMDSLENENSLNATVLSLYRDSFVEIGSDRRHTVQLGSSPTGEAYKELVLGILALDFVYHMEWTAVVNFANYHARGLVQNGMELLPDYNRKKGIISWDFNLTGDGQVVAVIDSGVDYRSCFFAESLSETPREPPFVNYDARASPETLQKSFDSSRRKIVQYVIFRNDFDDSGHGTHVCGSILGEPIGESSHVQYNGMAPSAKLAFFDISEDGELGLPSDFKKMFDYAYATGARIHSNSWGSPDNFYTSHSEAFDRYAFDNKDMLFLIAAGNYGKCHKKNTVGSPATSKNALTVGASMNTGLSWQFSTNGEFVEFGPKNFDGDSLASFSSEGPTGDGRVKPDIVAPGYEIISADDEQHSGSLCGETSLSDTLAQMSGTSMATPIVAGHVALIREYFQKGVYPSGRRSASDGFTPSGGLMKNVVIHGGRAMKGAKLANDRMSNPSVCGDADPAFASLDTGVRPNTDIGYGRFQMSESLFLEGLYKDPWRFYHIPTLDTASVDGTLEYIERDALLQNSDQHTYDFCVFPSPGGKSLDLDMQVRITLVWVDAPASPRASPALVNDLDLVVEYALHPNVVHYGNEQYAETEYNSPRDHLNTVEALYLSGVPSSESKKDLTIHVEGYSLNVGAYSGDSTPGQLYSVIISGYISAGKCAFAVAPGQPGGSTIFTDFTLFSIALVGSLGVLSLCLGFYMAWRKHKSSVEAIDRIEDMNTELEDVEGYSPPEVPKKTAGFFESMRWKSTTGARGKERPALGSLFAEKTAPV